MHLTTTTERSVSSCICLYIFGFNGIYQLDARIERLNVSIEE